MNPLIDHLLHGGEFIAFLSVTFYAIRYINRRESIERDYPPHRHVNGKILYPPDRRPGAIETMGIPQQ